MADVTVKLTGTQELLAKLKKWQIIKKEACAIALKEVGFKVETQAKANTPVDSGRLRASISTNWSGSGMSQGKTGGQAKSGDGIGQPAGEKGLTVVVGTNVEYSEFVEWSEKAHHKVGGPHFLFGAYFSYEGEAEKRIATIMKKDENL